MHQYIECTKQDNDNVPNLRWIAELNNNETVFDDVFKPDAWYRLKDYVEHNSLSIRQLRLQFRSHIEVAIDGIPEGVFFSRGMAATYGQEEAFSYYITGILRNGQIDRVWWNVPELTYGRTDTIPLLNNEAKTIFNGKKQV